VIQFNVIRASRLLLALAIILLLAVLAIFGIRFLAQRHAPPINSAARLVEMNAADEVKTAQVFASSGNSDALSPPPESGIQIEVIRRDEKNSRQQRILIYHTHTHEAYEQVDGDPYEALEAWRTADTGHSVVRVGEALASRLRRYGFDVVHDVTDHEGSQLSTAYTRSLATLMRYSERFDLYIDLHRDAYIEGDPVAVTSDTGEEMAPVMLLIGNGNGFDVKPWYTQNLSFAQALEARINRESPGLCKPVLVKDGRYNQNIGVFSVLIEVGHNQNTLVQACNSVAPIARAIYSLLVESPDPELLRMKTEWQASHPMPAGINPVDARAHADLPMP
jgi:stage II sporulation protein P